ncbi:MAG: S8 family peptidase [Saprospiraceae bacterium]|nr:S8 family peptidase [Saprospiraceae bacterium]
MNFLKPSAFYLLVLFSFILSARTVFCQNTIFIEDFKDSMEVVTNWTQGGMQLWDWRDDGVATGGAYWGNRSRIIAPSGEGAIVFNSDSIAATGTSAPHDIRLVSPIIGISGQTTVFLEFYQYYRNYQSTTTLEYSLNGGGNWTLIDNINNDVTENIETPRLDRKVYDLSPFVAGQPELSLRFSFSGDNYFWILDDVRLYDGEPKLETNPPYLGDSLIALGKPYLVDSLGGAFNPEQLIVKFVAGTPEPVKQSIRDEFAVYDVQYCDCDSLELWFIDGASDTPGGLSPTGGTIGVLANKDQAKSKSEVDGVDLNHYNYSQIQVAGDSCATQAGSLIDIILPEMPPPPGPEVPVIAILDTGIDYKHDSLVTHIWRGPEPPTLDFEDNDGNCYPDDFFGWNFICDNNNPFDDHYHGTHVSGIVVKQLLEHLPDSCDFRIMPLKTHDRNGIAELFDVICGTYYAYKNGADVINDSWGWYGVESTILRGAIEDAKDAGTLVVAAAGNDTKDISDERQYPATHATSNIITVGALNENLNGLAGFSNTSNTEVDIAAAGENIISTLPNDMMGPKSGTSMAAPMVSAAAAIAYCGGTNDPVEVRTRILDCAETLTSLTADIKNGKILDFKFPCLVPANEIMVANPLRFYVFPNPTTTNFWLSSEEAVNDHIEVNLLNQLGQTVKTYQLSQLAANEKIEIDLGDLSNGLYFLKVQIGYKSWIGQVVKLN